MDNFIQLETPEVILMWPFLLEPRETLSGDKEFQLTFLMKENIWKNSQLRVVIDEILKSHNVEFSKLARPFFSSGKEIFESDMAKYAPYESFLHNSKQFKAKRKESRGRPFVVDVTERDLSDDEIRCIGNGTTARLNLSVALTQNPKIPSQKYITIFFTAVQVIELVRYEVKEQKPSFSAYRGEGGFVSANQSSFSGTGIAQQDAFEDDIAF